MTDFPAVVYIKGSHLNIPASKSENVKESCMEHIKKKMKVGKLLPTEKDNESLKDFLVNFNKEITKRLENIERQVDVLSGNYDVLEKKVESLSSVVSKQNETLRTTVVNREHVFCEDGVGPAVPVSSKVTFITLNREEDFPNGTWLGDPDNPERRVRCHISPTDLFHIHTTCTTAEKMALTLLDYLFDRETQACSNISGMGKHKKKQLDPLLVYGIKCHLTFHFGITEHDWNKIKQNVDSKCRTAFRRKIKGLPLTPKGPQSSTSHTSDLETRPESLHFSDSVSQNSIVNNGLVEQLSNESITFQVIKSESEANIMERASKEEKGPSQDSTSHSSELETRSESLHFSDSFSQNSIVNNGLAEQLSDESITFQVIKSGSEANILERVIKEEKGDFQILHATVEEVAEIQQSHSLQL